MIVVSDTTPLNYLVIIDEIDVLGRLFTQVYVPPSVLNELSHARAPDAVRRWVQAGADWLRVEEPRARLASTLRLGPGEADAISLAKELNIQDILIDERRGARIAMQEGLSPIPTLAVIERAAERELLDLPAVVQKLRRTNARIAQQYLDAALDRDAKRRDC